MLHRHTQCLPSVLRKELNSCEPRSKMVAEFLGRAWPFLERRAQNQVQMWEIQWQVCTHRAGGGAWPLRPIGRHRRERLRALGARGRALDSRGLLTARHLWDLFGSEEFIASHPYKHPWVCQSPAWLAWQTAACLLSFLRGSVNSLFSINYREATAKLRCAFWLFWSIFRALSLLNPCHLAQWLT